MQKNMWLNFDENEEIKSQQQILLIAKIQKISQQFEIFMKIVSCVKQFWRFI